MLVAAARHRLPGQVSSAHGPVVLETHEIEGIRAFCRTDRISGLLVGALLAGEITIDAGDATDAQVELLHGDWYEALRACVLLEALLVRTGARLDAANIRWMATKGPAVAHLDFDDPALRTFGDIDLVIHPDDWNHTVDLLIERATSGRWHHEYVRRYGKGVTAVVDDMEVDLHLRFAVGRFGARCRTDECFDRPDRIELAGRPIPTPATSHRLLHACFHAALGGERELRAFRDVAQIALSSPDSVEATWQTAQRWGVEAVVAAAILETWRRLHLPMDRELVERARATPVDRADARALAVFARRSGFRPQALTTLGALPWSERPRFVRTAWMMSRERRR